MIVLWLLCCWFVVMVGLFVSGLGLVVFGICLYFRLFKLNSWLGCVRLFVC